MIEMLSEDDFLEHYGKKGMKWGVRKEKAHSSGPGWTIHADGSIDIKAGAKIQRVVRGHAGLMGGVGQDFGTADAMYASFTALDNTSYEHGFGRKKGLFVKEASRVLTFSPKVPLKSPPPKLAAKTYLELLKRNPESHAIVKDNLGGMTKLMLKKAIENPESDNAQLVYGYAYDMGNYNPKALAVNQRFTKELGKKGYNMLMDPVDSATEFNAPVVVFNAKSNVELVSQRIVDKVSQEVVRKQYNSQIQTAGRSIMETLGYV